METRKFIKKSKILIINADDYGCQPEIDEGILELWKNEKIKSFSVIVNQRNSEKAIQRIMEVKKTNSNLYQQTSIGIHFNLTRGRALSQDMKNSPFVQNGLFIKQKVLKQMHQLQVISKQTIANELTAQVELFIKLLRRRPSHLDSHNYLHIFPYFAEIIAPIIVKFGIYRIRNIIIGNLESLTNKYELNFSQSVRSYQQHNIQSTDIFLGYQDAGNLSVSKIKETFQDNLKQKSFVSIQLMCHPGYPTCNQQSWMGKNDRLKEKNQLQGQQFQKLSKQIGGIASYFDLQKPVNMLKHKRLLIFSKLLTGTGNLTTSMRLRLIFQKLGYEVYTWSVQHEIDFDVQVEDLSKFLYNFNISLIIGINVSRSAQIIHEAVFSKTKITIQVPYILIIAGTDANINFKKYQTLVEYKESLKDCQCLVSLSSTMAALSEEALKMLNIHKKIYTISQSSFSPYMCNSLPFIIKAPYILYPTSFRKIKCVQHILVQLNTIIDTYNFQVILIGPIIETEYYQKLKSQLKKIKYLGQVSQQYSLSLMKHAFMVINTSIEQGMSCSILQAFTYKIPVVARNNSGNSQLIKNGYNGLLYQHPSQFQLKFKLLLTDAQLKQSMAEKAYQLVIQKYNFQDQLKKYGQMIEIQIEKKTMILQIGNSQIKVFNQQFVHNTSVVNNTAYLQMQPQFKEEINILDLGCGTAIFSLIFMLKAKYSTINLHLSDIDPLILGNALYNCRQSSFKHQIRSITLYQSNLFQNINSTIRFDIVLFCPPQTPFRLNQSRPDKNGGPDSLRYFQPFFLHISNFSNDCRSYLMHSSMAWPSKCQQLLKRYNLQIKWRSKKGIHIIHKDEYNKMQQNLQALIMQHCKNGRAEIQLKDDLFYVPIQLYLIQKFCQ